MPSRDFGDAIQFLRYLPMVVELRTGKSSSETPAELQRLVVKIARGWQVVVRGQALPAFNIHCPLLTLPMIFRD